MMTGIFYDPARRRLHVVAGPPHPDWLFVTHDTGARPHQCRRIMRDWLPPEELCRVDWSGVGRAPAA